MLTNKTILITGGTGSFGKAFVKRILRDHSPKKVIVFSRDELKQYEMAQEIADGRIRFFLGDVRDKDRLCRAFTGVDIVIHAAALKQVPAAEYNPLEFIKTNVMGSANVIDAAIDCNVGRVVALSTDKAVNPINLYGATKLCAEKLFIAANSYSGDHHTRFGVVRYGNVVGSRGSVVPLFLKCRDNGRVYPVTDPAMTRFWITMDQAIDLVLYAINSSGYGGIYIPKIPSSTLTELVQAIDADGSIKVVGLRPGEKLHETLISAEEVGWELAKYYVVTGRGGPDYDAIGPYTSDANPHKASIDELRALIALT